MYNFGQFRRDNRPFSTPVILGTINMQQVDGDINFVNPCVNINEPLDNQNQYYFRFGVKQRKDSAQTISLKLRNTDLIEDNEQLIENFDIRAAGKNSNENIIYFQVIISPNAIYNQIIWELKRIPLDYNTQIGEQYGRVAEIANDYTCTKLINILTYLGENVEYLKKIGIQGPPSLLMCINREQIRIGKTGIYEINHDDIYIDSINFVPKNSDYFIMDFEY